MDEEQAQTAAMVAEVALIYFHASIRRQGFVEITKDDLEAWSRQVTEGRMDALQFGFGGPDERDESIVRITHRSVPGVGMA